jgi:uncharacterized protein YjbI with pentapeptide repeats
MELNNEYKETKWEMKKKIENKTFKAFDFSDTLFNYPIFKNVQFEDCLFNKSDMTDARIYGCSFINCHFMKINFSTATLGAHKGLFKNCRFDSCDFRNASFYEPEFKNCTFNKCKLNRIDFKASSFESCKFIGKMSDVIFRGTDKSDLYPNPMPNPMYNIDFSEAIFGEYVDFDDCDLSTCIPPKGTTFEELLIKSKYYPNRFGTGRYTTKTDSLP